MTSDSQHPFFRPLWRRITTVMFCFAWSAFEFYNANQTWGLITLGIAAYAVWTLLISYQVPSPPSAKPGADDDV